MQRIYPSPLGPEQYVATEAHRQVRAEGPCPHCGRGPLHRHGWYVRGVTGVTGQLLEIAVARFRCMECGRTVSYLPSFALSYRLVQAATFEAFLEGKLGRGDVQRWEAVLQDYERRMQRFARELWRIIGCGLGRAPPGDGAVWPWVKAACGGLASAARLLVTRFGVTLFARYQCHQPLGA